MRPSQQHQGVPVGRGLVVHRVQPVDMATALQVKLEALEVRLEHDIGQVGGIALRLGDYEEPVVC